MRRLSIALLLALAVSAHAEDTRPPSSIMNRCRYLKVTNAGVGANSLAVNFATGSTDWGSPNTRAHSVWIKNSGPDTLNWDEFVHGDSVAATEVATPVAGTATDTNKPLASGEERTYNNVAWIGLALTNQDEDADADSDTVEVEWCY